MIAQPRRPPVVQRCMRNLRLAFRTLFKTPLVTVVAIVSLALGIGANAAIYSLFDELLRAPLPVPHPERLVNLGGNNPSPGSHQCGIAGNCQWVFSYRMFRDLEAQPGPFSGVAGHVAITTLSAAFAGLATLLAAIGLYGVLAYSVVRRTKEIGVRMALGADSPSIVRMVLRHVAVMTVVGMAIGAGGAYAIGKGAQSLLFGISARDPLVMAAAAAVLALVALVAGSLPAMRASRVDPVQALRYE